MKGNNLLNLVSVKTQAEEGRLIATVGGSYIQLHTRCSISNTGGLLFQ